MTKKNTASEYSIVRRLHFLFQRALQKFKGDIQLWAAYFAFCQKSGSTKLLGRAFARAIQYHPLNTGKPALLSSCCLTCLPLCLAVAQLLPGIRTLCILSESARTPRTISIGAI